MKKTYFILLFFAFFSYAQWQPDVRLTNDNAFSFTSNNNAWCVAASGNIVHVVWRDDRDGNFEIYYKRSTDAGISWAADTRLTNNTAFSSNPAISASGSFVHIVWVDERDGNAEIYYKRSTDAGVSWGADTRLTNNPAESANQSVSVSGSSVHVVWVDRRNSLKYQVYYKRSTDGGVNWGSDVQLTNFSYSVAPCISISGPAVHIAFRDDHEGNMEIYYKRSTDGGESWSTNTRLTYNTALSEFPSISVSGSFVHVVWYDNRDANYEIYYKCSTDGGVNWGPDTRLTINSSASFDPSITSSGSNIHVVWRDERDGNGEIYYKRSVDEGISWGADTRLTNNTASSLKSTISVSSLVVHVVWYDFRDGNYEIYYKRDPTGNSIGIIKISSQIPEKFYLSQNYPNPFNPVTKIRFDVPSVGQRHAFDVQLVIYDILGREIATLVNEQLSPGSYEVEWNAADYPSGIYYYKLTTGDFVDAKKMMLVK